jgi:hypothetical protein
MYVFGGGVNVTSHDGLAELWKSIPGKGSRRRAMRGER